MNTLVLPGINQKTEKWAGQLAVELALDQGSTTIQRYGHWQGGGDQCLDLEGELERLAGQEVELLIGKSIGVIIGLQACHRRIITPRRTILIGTPVSTCLEENIDLTGMAATLAIPALYIQQKDDVVGTSAMLCQQVGQAPLATVVEVAGNNHQYKDIKLLVRHIGKWLTEK